MFKDFKNNFNENHVFSYKSFQILTNIGYSLEKLYFGLHFKDTEGSFILRDIFQGFFWSWRSKNIFEFVVELNASCPATVNKQPWIIQAFIIARFECPCSVVIMVHCLRACHCTLHSANCLRNSIIDKNSNENLK